MWRCWKNAGTILYFSVKWWKKIKGLGLFNLEKSSWMGVARTVFPVCSPLPLKERGGKIGSACRKVDFGLLLGKTIWLHRDRETVTQDRYQACRISCWRFLRGDCAPAGKLQRGAENQTRYSLKFFLHLHFCDFVTQNCQIQDNHQEAAEN